MVGRLARVSRRPAAEQTGCLLRGSTVVLAAGQRLRRSKDFAAAIRGGRRAGRTTVVVHLTEPTDHSGPVQMVGPARAGFVVSKAVGGAVVRNTVRRRLRHLVRERLPQLAPGTTLVVRALPGAATASYSQLSLDLDGALASARFRGRDRGNGRDRGDGPGRGNGRDQLAAGDRAAGGTRGGSAGSDASDGRAEAT